MGDRVLTTVTIKKVDKELWQLFKAYSHFIGSTVQDTLNDAIRRWIENHQN